MLNKLMNDIRKEIYETIEKLGYLDNLIDTTEIFHLWVIEGYNDLFSELPLDKCNLNVVLTDKLSDYRTIKVRILNGAHTSMIPYALLQGVEAVGDCLKDKIMSAHLKSCLGEIVDSLDMDREEALNYASSVMQRFSNPYIRHMCQSIALNSVSKFKVRVLPSILQYKEKYGKYPQALMLAFAKLIEFNKKGTPNDGEEIMKKMKDLSVAQILSDASLWGQDLSSLTPYVEELYANS